MEVNDDVSEQCSILFIKTGRADDQQIKGLRSIGFHVVETDDIPAADVLSSYHAVIVAASAGCGLPMLATRLRAKPKFGRRVLIALVCPETSASECRDATACGFDVTMPLTCTARDLAASILRLLRPYPEYRCLLRAPNGRRKAA
ncbi:MAG TPA: hypothetical protein VN716_27915 [Vicinamibacterales bacterium]|nr:hypothetical protein [Vicinamibacterales bacterium]